MSEQVFSMTILGRTIEHLGTQMYKHRAPSIAELVANCWDAGAGKVWIEVPTDEDNYKQDTSSIIVMDDGEGMSPDAVEKQYRKVRRFRLSRLCFSIRRGKRLLSIWLSARDI